MRSVNMATLVSKSKSKENIQSEYFFVYFLFNVPPDYKFDVLPFL